MSEDHSHTSVPGLGRGQEHEMEKLTVQTLLASETHEAGDELIHKTQ